MKLIGGTFLSILILLALFSAAQADQVARPDDWPMYMYNAQHTGFNDSSTLKPPLHLSWWSRVFDSAQFLNELAVANGHVLVTHGDTRAYQGMGLTSVAVCLNSGTGDIDWTYDFGYTERLYPPAIAYGQAYVQVSNGGGSYLSGLDLTSGQQLWKTYYIEQNMDRLAPTIWNGRILCGSGYDGGMECFDAYNGQAYWQRSTIDYEDWTPAVHNGKAYTFLNGYLVVYSVSDGSVDWYLNIVGTAASTNTACFISYMGVAPVLDTVRQVAYLMWHQYFTAVDLQTRSVLWKNWGNFGCGINPAICNGQVFAIDSGIVKCLDGQTGAEVWRYQAAVPFLYPPVVANGYVYVSGTNLTVALSLTTHEEVWRGQYGGYLAIAGKMLYIAGQDGWLIAFDQGHATDVNSDETLPRAFALNQNYPNPFNPSTTISFDLPKRETVKLTVFDITGRVVKTLLNKSLAAGTFKIQWDGTDLKGKHVASGVYLYRLEAGEYRESRKMVLLK